MASKFGAFRSVWLATPRKPAQERCANRSPRTIPNVLGDSYLPEIARRCAYLRSLLRYHFRKWFFRMVLLLGDCWRLVHAHRGGLTPAFSLSEDKTCNNTSQHLAKQIWKPNGLLGNASFGMSHVHPPMLLLLQSQAEYWQRGFLWCSS